PTVALPDGESHPLVRDVSLAPLATPAIGHAMLNTDGQAGFQCLGDHEEPGPDDHSLVLPIPLPEHRCPVQSARLRVRVVRHTAGLLPGHNPPSSELLTSSSRPDVRLLSTLSIPTGVRDPAPGQRPADGVKRGPPGMVMTARSLTRSENFRIL